MSSHPANLAFRFVLELAALAGMTMWGWQQAQGTFRYAIALGIPVLAAVLWGTFAVPHDPSRSGSAPVPVRGVLRLGIEGVFFAFAAWALYAIGQRELSVILVIAVSAHYAVSYDRVAWLLRA
jgi:hypothetical protein